jgi:hypothetical protein
MSNKNDKQVTVKELIERLKSMPPDYPVFVRAKYAAPLQGCEDVEIKAMNVCEMHPDSNISDLPKNVTILV